MPAVSSSAISYADYDLEKKELYLTFKSGRTYTYSEVPEAIYNEFLSSSSKGKYYNLYIKDVYSEA